MVMISKEKIIRRFVSYVTVDTQSDPHSNTTPSTKKQLVLANLLVEELKEIGLQKISIDDKGYIMASIPATTNKETPIIGFISHYDTSPDFSGTNVNPQIIENYNGKDIILISAAEYLVQHPEIKHGEIRIAFTPDEEIGRGAHHFDVEKFGASYAYTMDGSQIGELEYENFNAAGAKVIVKGKSVHPGYAKGKMVNSMLIAQDFINSLPRLETPEHTSDREGFFHLHHISGEIEETILEYIIRDHDKKHFEARKQMMFSLVTELNNQYGYDVISIEMNDQNL